jgi:hypothetical protein
MFFIRKTDNSCPHNFLGTNLRNQTSSCTLVLTNDFLREFPPVVVAVAVSLLAVVFLLAILLAAKKGTSTWNLSDPVCYSLLQSIPTPNIDAQLASMLLGQRGPLQLSTLPAPALSARTNSPSRRSVLGPQQQHTSSSKGVTSTLLPTAPHKA